MREILFRGKRLDNGEWVTGGGILRFYDEGNGKLCYIPKTGDNIGCIDDEKGNIAKLIGTFYAIDPETVGQYTGVTDRYGKKIFEGDLLGFCSNARPVTVKWLPDEGKFMGVGKGCLDGINFKDWSIVGNIYDNPELMEVKDGKA